MNRDSHAIAREKKGAGSAISATSPREFATSANRQRFDRELPLFRSRLSVHTIARMPSAANRRFQKTGDTAGDILGNGSSLFGVTFRSWSTVRRASFSVAKTPHNPGGFS